MCSSDLLLTQWRAHDLRKRKAEEERWQREQRRIALAEIARKAELDRRADALIKGIELKRSLPLTPPPKPTAAMSYVAKSGHNRYIGIAVKGQICFRVPAIVWQAMIFDKFLLQARKRDEPEFSTKWVHKCVREAGFIEPSFAGFIDEALELLVRAEHAEFRSPYSAIREYLKHLETAMLVLGGRGRWHPMPTVMRA